MAVESPRTLGIRGIQSMMKHRAQPFQSSPSTATPPITPPMDHHDDVHSSFSYPASFGGSQQFPSRPFRFSFKSMARQPSTSHHKKGHSTTTAEEYLRSVAKRDSDDGSKYGVLTDDPFRSESRPGEGTVVTTKVLQTGMETRATTMQRTLTRDTWLRKTITDVAGIWISHTTSARSR